MSHDDAVPEEREREDSLAIGFIHEEEGRSPLVSPAASEEREPRYRSLVDRVDVPPSLYTPVASSSVAAVRRAVRHAEPREREGRGLPAPCLPQSVSLTAACRTGLPLTAPARERRFIISIEDFGKF